MKGEAMSDERIRSYLRQVLSEVTKREKERVSAILDNADKSIAEGIEKMKPLIQLLKALKDEVGEVEGLKISLADAGHMATVRADTSVTTDSYSISTCYDNSAFTIEAFHSFSVDGSYHEEKKEYASAEEVITKVIELVGNHIGAQQAHNENGENA
jgi:hypothetical protein